MAEIPILILTTSYPLSDDASGGVFVQRLIATLPKRFRATVVVPADQENAWPSSAEGIEVKPFRYAPRPLRILAHRPGGIPVALRGNKLNYLLVPLLLLAMAWAAFREARKARLIQANWSICGVVGGMVGQLLKRQLVVTVRGEDVTRARKSKLEWLLFYLCVRLCSRMVGVSESVVEWLRDEFPMDAKKFMLIENGVQDEFLGITRPAREPGAPLQLVSVGSLIPRKGFDQVIDALGMLDSSIPWRLTIAGEGPERQTLTMRVVERGLQDNIRFVGALSPKQIPSLLGNSDLFVFASHSEGRPNAVIEAMAAGLPVVAGDIPGVRDIVRHGETGLLFEDGDTRRLAEYIDKLMTDAGARARLGNNGRQWVLDRGLSWAATGRRYASLFDKLLEDSHPCAAS